MLSTLRYWYERIQNRLPKKVSVRGNEYTYGQILGLEVLVNLAICVVLAGILGIMGLSGVASFVVLVLLGTALLVAEHTVLSDRIEKILYE